MADSNDIDINDRRRYGSYVVQFSALSDRWTVHEGIVLVDQFDEFSDAIRLAKQLSGYKDHDSDLFLPIPAVMTDLSKLTLSPDVTAGMEDLSGGTASMDFPSSDMSTGDIGGEGGGTFSGPSISDIGGPSSEIGGSSEMPEPTPEPASEPAEV